ncbi:MAG: bifunctional phosphoribosyl-AMP cyclohydrolase/phosphoribosyl-ATP diphosphatase HisIE [Bacteroidetes bacterium]|jgi:phosphoribosyl-ATP pyrophosphohydrolase/phosphoribosyl-AMP cyclohydrolase|nr:bifunctional phosphoribosyl-AMP cyclohydrolase/phosphoribosyl-ATP diphosphatase HisIE [Bacteroidota bacterium]
MIAPDPKLIDFEKGQGLVPAIVQDAHTGRVLMLGYMNAEAYQHTLQTEKATFYSRGKQRLWTKGESSGHYLVVKSISLDCDADTLLLKAKPKGPTCHTGAGTCWQEANTPNALFLHRLERKLTDRKLNPKPGSHTSQMFARGINKIAQKLGEEAVELVIEAKDSNRELFLNEAADLLYRFTTLLVAKGVQLEEVITTLAERDR